MDKLSKHSLPTVADLNLNIDLDMLRYATDKLANKFVDVRSANPMLCMNHEELVKSVYDNFEQINLTTPSEILPHTTKYFVNLSVDSLNVFKSMSSFKSATVGSICLDNLSIMFSFYNII